MLSSERWTIFDTYLVIALCVFALRLTVDDTAHAAYWQSDTPGQAQTDILAPPMPSASQTRRNSLDHVYLAVRCLGLAEMQRQNACAGTDAARCQQAHADLRLMERAMWPKGRPGQFAMAYRGKSNAYALAYLAAADGAYRAQKSSSELIITRDSAMCRQSQAYYEARLHEYEVRQPG